MPALPREVTYSQMHAACEALGLTRDASIRDVTISFGGEYTGLIVGVLARNNAGAFITDADGDPLMAHGHVPVSPDRVASKD